MAIPNIATFDHGTCYNPNTWSYWAPTSNWFLAPPCQLQLAISGQFIMTSTEVTPNGGLVREVSPKMTLNQVKDLY